MASPDANAGGEPPWQEGLAARRGHKMRWAPSHGAGASTHLVRWANAFAHSGPVDRAVAGSSLLSSGCGDATYPCHRHGEIQRAGIGAPVIDIVSASRAGRNAQRWSADAMEDRDAEVVRFVNDGAWAPKDIDIFEE